MVRCPNPRCMSEDCASYQAIVHAQTGTTHSFGVTGGHFRTSSGGGPLVAVTSSTGHSESALASTCRPPTVATAGCLPGMARMGALLMFASGVVGAVAAVSNAASGKASIGSAQWIGIGISILVGSGFFVGIAVALYLWSQRTVRRINAYNRTELPRLQAEWARSWVCLRCNQRFLV